MTQATGLRVVAIADADSFVKWAASLLGAVPGLRPHLLLVRTPLTASVDQQRTALAVGAVVEGSGIGLGGLGIHAQVHQGVATKVIGLAHNLIGSFCRPKHLGCSGKITRAVSGTALLDQLAIQGSPLYS